MSYTPLPLGSSYIPEGDEIEEENVNHITGYYCTCQSGARTLGSCAHAASILWYLGYARHQPNIRYPDGSLLETTMDVAHRAEQENPNADNEN